MRIQVDSPSNDASIGDVFYSIRYVGEDASIPLVTPYIYVGMDLMPPSTNSAFFQDAESYFEGRGYARTDDNFHDDADAEISVISFDSNHCPMLTLRGVIAALERYATTDSPMRFAPRR